MRATTKFILIAAVSIAPQFDLAQTAPSKPAEEVYKNIVQLRGTPADQLTPAMQFIASSLGVECTYCHVQGKMEADDKPAKKTAREMIAMTMMINKTAFAGRQQVTCYSCHRGSEHPVGVPPVLSDSMPMAPTAPAATAPTNAGPTADEIVVNYIAAVGGAEAMKKITSRVETGSIIVSGNSTPIQVITKAPNKRISITEMSASNHSITAFDGTSGWLGSTGHAARDMSAAESGAAGLDAEFYLPLRLKEIFPQLRRGRSEQIAGVDCVTLNGAGPGLPSVRLYFDAKTGLLVRLVRYAETPVGRNPTQIDYADYRDAGGVKIPFRWTLARTNGRFTIQISDVKSNVDVPDEKFAKSESH